MARRQDGGVLNQDNGTWFGSCRFGCLGQGPCRHGQQDNADEQPCPNGFCGVHRAPPAIVARTPGLVPVKSMSNPCTLIDPLSEVPSNVPLKSTSAGEPSIIILIVKLNLSTLRLPLIMLKVPRVPESVPESEPSLAIMTSSVESSGPSGVV